MRKALGKLAQVVIFVLIAIALYLMLKGLASDISTPRKRGGIIKNGK